MNFSGIVKKIFNWTAYPDPATFAVLEQNSEINKNLIIKFFNINENKQSIISEINELKDFYFTQMMVDRFIDDALNPAGSDQHIFKVSIKNQDGKEDKVTTKFIQDFIDEFNIERFLVDIAGDLLIYGEYFLRLDINADQDKNIKKGIINIHDDVDPTNIIPVFRDSDISYFIINKKGKLINEQPSKYVYFSLPSNRIKVTINTEDNKAIYFRMGKSIIYPALGLLKELKLLESIVPIKFINNALKTSLISVSVPSTTRPQDAIEITKTYEKMINNSLKIDVNNKNNSNQILKKLSEKVGQVKVIPNFGDKGTLEKQELTQTSDYNDVAQKILDLRKIILTTVGIPSSIIDDNNPSLKSDAIKEHIRYSRKLKSIQNSLKEGLKRLILIHLINNGFMNFIKDDIDIQFLNVLNTDDLEKLEYVDLMVSMMDNMKSFIEDINNDAFAKINYDEYIKFINNSLENIIGFNLLSPKPKSSNSDSDNPDSEGYS